MEFLTKRLFGAVSGKFSKPVTFLCWPGHCHCTACGVGWLDLYGRKEDDSPES